MEQLKGPRSFGKNHLANHCAIVFNQVPGVMRPDLGQDFALLLLRYKRSLFNIFIKVSI